MFNNVAALSKITMNIACRISSTYCLNAHNCFDVENNWSMLEKIFLHG